MHVTGHFKNIQYSENHKLVVCFEVEEKSKALEEIESIKSDLLIIDAQAKKDKRSLDANAYFWVLADKIAKNIKSDKWNIYIWLLGKYGVFQHIHISNEAKEDFKSRMLNDPKGTIRYIEEIPEGDETLLLCYFGTHTYNTTEMYELIQGTVCEAQGLGIETATPDEIAEMIMLMARKG